MIYTTNSRGNGGFMNNIGCLITGGLLLAGVFYLLRGLYFMLFWAAPALFVLALIINWKVVASTGKWMLQLLQKNPLMGLLTGALAVYFFPLLTLFWFFGALGSKRVEKMQREFGQQWGGAFGPFQNTNQEQETEFAEFEEIESKPKGQPDPEKDINIPPVPEKTDKKPDNPYDNIFQ
jgi:hypothetical protein